MAVDRIVVVAGVLWLAAIPGSVRAQEGPDAGDAGDEGDEGEDSTVVDIGVKAPDVEPGDLLLDLGPVGPHETPQGEGDPDPDEDPGLDPEGDDGATAPEPSPDEDASPQDEPSVPVDPAPGEDTVPLEHPGPLGHPSLLHTLTAPTGPPLTWSVGLSTAFFVRRGFLADGPDEDGHGHFDASLHFRIAPIRWLEIFAAVMTRVDTTDHEAFGDEVHHRFGDALIGLRGVLPVGDVYTLSLAVVPRFLTRLDSVLWDWSATGVAITLAQTVDLAAAANVPLRLHVNVGWDFDGSSRLVEGVEKQRSEEVGEQQHINRWERYVSGIRRVDSLDLAAGLELTFPWVRPFIEWNMSILVSRLPFDCPAPSDAGDDGCLAGEGARAHPMTMALGLRILPPEAAGFSILIAAEVAMLGVGVHVHEIAAVEPWSIHIGVAWTAGISRISTRD